MHVYCSDQWHRDDRLRQQNKTSPCIALLKGFDIFKRSVSCVICVVSLEQTCGSAVLSVTFLRRQRKVKVNGTLESGEGTVAVKFCAYRMDAILFHISFWIKINLETGLLYVVDTSRKRGDLNFMVNVSTNSFSFWTWPCLLEMHKLQNCASVNCELNPIRSSSRSWNTFVRATC